MGVTKRDFQVVEYICSLLYFQYVAADVFSFFSLSCTVFST